MTVQLQLSVKQLPPKIGNKKTTYPARLFYTLFPPLILVMEEWEGEDNCVARIVCIDSPTVRSQR
jgi:hypothetical protein